MQVSVEKMLNEASAQTVTVRRDRNRKRSRRRSIYCPIHVCYLDSVSQKQRLFVNDVEQLRARGLSRKQSLLLLSQQTTVPLTEEWIEAFWCDDCQETSWYHVRRNKDASYSVSLAPRELWNQAQGVVDPFGNPSVGEFSRRHSSMSVYHTMKQTTLV